MSEDYLAIWRRLTPTQRRAVVEADWRPTPGPVGATYTAWIDGDCFCPLGLALPGSSPHPLAYLVAESLADTIDLDALDARVNGDGDAFTLLYRAEIDAITREARAFIDAWDRGEIAPDALRAALRALGTSAVGVTP